MVKEYGTFFYGDDTYGIDDFGIEHVEHTYLNLRVYFTDSLKVNDALLNPDYYQITVTDPTSGYDFGVVSVTAEDTSLPMYVDLEVTDCTGDENYTLTITPNVIQDEDDEWLLEPNNTANFTGVTDPPEVLYAVPLSSTTVRVTFSKYMTQNPGLYNPANYTWTNGLITLSVEPETNTSVILTTTEQEPGVIYELTVS